MTQVFLSTCWLLLQESKFLFWIQENLLQFHSTEGESGHLFLCIQVPFFELCREGSVRTPFVYSLVYINFARKHSGEVTGIIATLMTGPSPNLQTAHEGNEVCHYPNVLKYRNIRIMVVSLLSPLVKSTQWLECRAAPFPASNFERYICSIYFLGLYLSGKRVKLSSASDLDVLMVLHKIPYG